MNDLTKARKPSEKWFSFDAWESGNAWLQSEQASGQEEAWQYANAGQERVRPSVPFIIRLVNACTTAIASVDVGDSFLQRAASNFGQSSNITLTSVPAGTSYIEFLAQTESQPFNVGETVIISATASQFNETITITHRDASGKRSDEVIVLTLDPYQVQTDRLTIRREYMFDGYTRLRFSNIVASATVTVHMYPTDKFSPVQAAVGRPAVNKYSPPQIVKVLPTAVRQPMRLGVR